jgi:hypothetical protein
MNMPEAEKRLTALFCTQNEAQAAHELARQMMMEQITQKFIPFKKGDEVWLDSKNLKLPYPTRKLALKREGPFPIIEVISPLSYRLKLPEQWKIHPMFHAHLLTPFREMLAHGSNYLRPPPDLIDGIEEHEVEFITWHRLCGCSQQYLVKWKGYSTVDNMWEPESNLEHAAELLKEYKTDTRYNSSANSLPMSTPSSAPVIPDHFDLNFLLNPEN